MIRTSDIDPLPAENECHIQSITTFQNHLKEVAPEWIRDLKRSNWERFGELPLPSRGTESWRFAKTDDLSPEGFSLPSRDRGDDLASIPQSTGYVDDASGEILLGNDRTLKFGEASSSLCEKGLIWMPLDEAFRKHPDLLQDYFLKEAPDLGSEKYQALHAALVGNGTLLYVPPGLEVKLPFLSYNWNAGKGLANFPHTLVIADSNARVDFAEYFQSAPGSGPSFVCAMASVFARSGSRVFYKAVQDWSLNTVSFHLNSVVADRDAEVKTVILNLGSSHTRNEQHTRIVGEGCNVENYSLSVPTGDQEFDQRTLQSHSAPNSRSNLLYKNALGDNSRTIFSGLIKVDKIAQQTDAYQTNRNLLLSNRAEANALPGLEILANDVKCSHGATTGKLDDEQLYYLLTRGIRKPLAQQLLVFGFFEEIIEKIESEELRTNLRELMQRKLQN